MIGASGIVRPSEFPPGWFPPSVIGAFPPLVEFAVVQRAGSGPADEYERAGTKAVSGDHIPLDHGYARNPRTIERNTTLAYAPESVTRARRGLRSDLRSLKIPDARVDDAALVLSELLSNALRHARPLPDHTVGVSWRIEMEDGASEGGRLEIAVRDGGSSSMPRVARPSISGLGGRGLGIVQSLAGRWGTEMDATTTMVWAVLEIAPTEPPGVSDDTDVGLPVSLAGEGGALRRGTGVVELDSGARRGEPVWGAVF